MVKNENKSLLKHPLAYSCNKLLLDTIDNNRNKCTDPLSV